MYFSCILGFLFTLALGQSDISDLRIYGSANLEPTDSAEKVDMWDKKNEALENAKERATIALVKRILSATELTQYKEKIEELIVPRADRFLVSSEVMGHGAGNKYYNVEVLYKYSLSNLKELLRVQGVLFKEVKEPKVVSFVEVMDFSKVESSRWWLERESISLHPALKPLRKKMAAGFKEKGMILLPPAQISNPTSLKESAIAQGAHYYVKGVLKVEDDPRGFQVKKGEFFIYEALSQKMVTSIDLEQVLADAKRREKVEAARNKSMVQRGLASLPKKQDKRVIQSAFKDAAVKMSQTNTREILNSGVSLIRVDGISQPAHIAFVKAYLGKNLGNAVASVIERRIARGSVLFSLRTNSSPLQLARILNGSGQNPGLVETRLMDNGKGLITKLSL